MWWRFVGWCGHTVEGRISEVEAHIYGVHDGEQGVWQMFNPETDALVDTFTWPLA